MIKKLFLLAAIAVSLGFTALAGGLNSHQALAIAIFSASITGTLFFWDFRLSFAFIGTSLLLFTRTIDLEHVIRFASLDVILFLVGMMILVAMLKDDGFFSLVTHRLLHQKDMTAGRFVVILSLVSAVLSAATSEVISIIFITAAVLEICGHLKTDPAPFVILAVMATNVGSAATVLGNPIGILIASKAGLTFEDFLVKALPLSALCLLVTIGICLFWFRRTIAEFDAQIVKRRDEMASMAAHPVPFSRDLKISLFIFGATLVFIALHHRLELLWGLEPNTILLTVPLFTSGIAMIWRWRKARDYVEKDVEWWTLIFFMLLFAQAGTLQYTGATGALASRLAQAAGQSYGILLGLVLWISSLLSAVLDNVVLVAAFIPVIQNFKTLSVPLQPFWWALLFGGCLGGNITLVGSTANIIAIGILEKERKTRISFLQWLKIGAAVGIITTAIVWIVLLFVPLYH